MVSVYNVAGGIATIQVTDDCLENYGCVHHINIYIYYTLTSLRRKMCYSVMI